VNLHDFEDKKLGKVVPYGVYDVTANAGFVSVGITSDTAEVAVQSIRCWHERIGRQRYPNARELTITADCGGSNAARVRLWKMELQKLADETGLVIHVHHYPPGTSKILRSADLQANGDEMLRPQNTRAYRSLAFANSDFDLACLCESLGIEIGGNRQELNGPTSITSPSF
jgi:Rhodopirellula transposase DDE domain